MLHLLRNWHGSICYFWHLFPFHSNRVSIGVANCDRCNVATAPDKLRTASGCNQVVQPVAEWSLWQWVCKPCSVLVFSHQRSWYLPTYLHRRSDRGLDASWTSLTQLYRSAATHIAFSSVSPVHTFTCLTLCIARSLPSRDVCLSVCLSVSHSGIVCK